jgi:hypothetical protein
VKYVDQAVSGRVAGLCRDHAGMPRAVNRQPVKELGVLRPNAKEVRGGGEERVEDGGAHWMPVAG